VQSIPKNKRPRNTTPPVYDRALLLHGSKRNEVLSLAEIEQYGRDSFADPDYLSIYGMSPREWYGCGIRLLERTAVECTRDAFADRIGRDVASVATRMPSDHLSVIDPFAGSCNTLFWILQHLPNSEGIAFESDPQVFDLTRRNLATVAHRIELLNGDYAGLLADCRVPEDRGIIAFVAPPWGTALDEQEGLDLCRTTPPISEIIEGLVCRFSKHKMLFAIQAQPHPWTSTRRRHRPIQWSC
jgi:RNA cap guanine-N2 methyltransferase